MQQPGSVPAGGDRPPGRRRLILVLVAGVMALLCLGGGGVVFLLYEQETRIDREEPDQVVSSYLRAYLVSRDDGRARLLTCDGQPASPEIAALRTDVESRERSFTMGVTFTWSSLDVQVSDGRGTVTTDLRRAVSDGSESIADRWSFQVADRDGWRVCGASKVS